MGLLQKACETYDAMEHLAGVEITDRETLAPVSHITTRAQIEITLDADGRFRSARTVDKKEPKILIPATESSAGRTQAPCAHPLCEQLGYLAPVHPEKYRLYVEQLADWDHSEYSHPKLQPILRYVQSGTILQDLARSEILRLNPQGAPENENDEKLLVRWVVVGLGEDVSGPCWTDRKLMRCFIDYYASRPGALPESLCMISGRISPPAAQHPKGISPINGNAKLISANDGSGFTYRGRFDDPSQAATIGYLSSQKAHCALRWLIANQGSIWGDRTFICWNPQGISLPPVTGSMRRRSKQEPRAATPTEYRRQLSEALNVWKEDLPAQAGVVIAAFDAATPGRLALTYYNELQASDFLQRLHDWEESCCWENASFGIQSPSLYHIVNWAFGVQRNQKPETDPRILRQQMQRLISCRVDRMQFPLDIERALVQKASQLLLYEETERKNLLFVACAGIRKYHIDHFKEEWNMALDKENTNRSYLFGRLLAIADTVERKTYEENENRETNALRMQKAFALRPLSGWRILEEKLEPYYRRLKPGLRQYFRCLTQEIADKLPASGEDLNRKLDDVYLLGYYHQKAYRPENTEIKEKEED
ncbi:MAG: type I-C CRISPR-associated protein Cas8c/Csd1 [Lachnospiraceae bacterium]|nr:type I-C CRISPR-associated protein Cas8c/Csd1 [Lachnospiraceae bacterium]